MPCATCGKDISRFYGKTVMGMCDNCKKAYCPSCMKSNKHGICPSCGGPLNTTKSMLQQTPEDWKSKPCPKCNKRIPLNSSFCDGCGYNFNQAIKSGDWKNKLILGQFGVIGILIIALVLVIKFA